MLVIFKKTCATFGNVKLATRGSHMNAIQIFGIGTEKMNNFFYMQGLKLYEPPSVQRKFYNGET